MLEILFISYLFIINYRTNIYLVYIRPTPDYREKTAPYSLQDKEIIFYLCRFFIKIHNVAKIGTCTGRAPYPVSLVTYCTIGDGPAREEGGQ